jgi:nucleotide-binding universal stress UspA family protein
MRTSVAEPIARASEEMTLFVPHGVGGFVSPQDGGTSLTNVLIPVDHKPSPCAAIEAAARLAAIVRSADVRCTLLHVGERRDAPGVQLPDLPNWTWEWSTVRGDVVEAILETAARVRADLLIMATAGHHGFLDALRGSTTERVLRGARCPLLAIPARFSIPPG